MKYPDEFIHECALEYLAKQKTNKKHKKYVKQKLMPKELYDCLYYSLHDTFANYLDFKWQQR